MEANYKLQNYLLSLDLSEGYDTTLKNMISSIVEYNKKFIDKSDEESTKKTIVNIAKFLFPFIEYIQMRDGWFLCENDEEVFLFEDGEIIIEHVEDGYIEGLIEYIRLHVIASFYNLSQELIDDIIVYYSKYAGREKSSILIENIHIRIEKEIIEMKGKDIDILLINDIYNFKKSQYIKCDYRYNEVKKYYSYKLKNKYSKKI